MLQVRRPVYENGRGRQRPTGSSNTAARSSSRPAPDWLMTSSSRFRFAELPTASSRQPIFRDARIRRGVLSQLPVSLPEAVTSRTTWNKPRCNTAALRRSSSQSNVVTTDYGWIDSSDADRDDESDKENCAVETEELDDRDRDLRAGGQRSGEPFEVEVISPWKSPNASISMDVDDDNYVDMKQYNILETAPSGVRLTLPPRCCPEGPSVMPQVLRHRLPLGTIDEAVEPSSTKSLSNSSESLSLGCGYTVDEPEPEEELGGVRQKPATAENFYEPMSRSSPSASTADNDDEDVRSQRMDPEAVQSDNITDVSVRQRCAGWRFSSSRPRLTVAEFCRRRRHDTETKKRQRSASVTDDSVSVNDSINSLGPSTKRRRTSLKVL